MRRVLVATVLVVLVPGVAAAGGPDIDFSACAGYSEGTSISMQDSCFSGTAHFAPSGTPITIANDGRLPHTMTAVDGSFDTGLLESGASTELVFDEPGIYPVFCALHATLDGDGMAGVVVVGEAVPAAMAAPLDTSAFSEVVEAQNESLFGAIDAQAAAIHDLGTAQAEVLAALEEATAGQPTVPAEIVVVSEDARAVEAAVMIVAGLATGLGLASLLMVLRQRFGARSASEHPHPVT